MCRVPKRNLTSRWSGRLRAPVPLNGTLARRYNLCEIVTARGK